MITQPKRSYQLNTVSRIRRQFGWLPEEKVSESPVHPATMYSYHAVHPQICREGAIHIHFGLQSGHWTYGSGQFDFEPQIQRKTNRMSLSACDERRPNVLLLPFIRDTLQ